MMTCIIIDADKESRKLLELLVKEIKSIKLLQSCGSLVEAEEILTKNKVDIIFIDPSKPSEQTLDFLTFLPYLRPHIVVMSSQIEFAKEAFDMDATDFILKPVSRLRVVKSIVKIIKSNPQLNHKNNG